MDAPEEELADSFSAALWPVRPCPAELVAAWSIGGRRAGSSTPVVAFAQLASVAEPADAPALGAGVFGREGSSPSARTHFSAYLPAGLPSVTTVGWAWVPTRSPTASARGPMCSPARGGAQPKLPNRTANTSANAARPPSCTPTASSAARPALRRDACTTQGHSLRSSRAPAAMPHPSITTKAMNAKAMYPPLRRHRPVALARAARIVADREVTRRM